jgi:hypothetical protein
LAEVWGHMAAGQLVQEWSKVMISGAVKRRQ